MGVKNLRLHSNGVLVECDSYENIIQGGSVANKIQQCLKDNHDLMEIYRASYSNKGDAVVKWCRTCGAVVVDLEYDGKIVSGGVIKMMKSKLLR